VTSELERYPVSLPNLITLGRLLAVPLAIWLVLGGHMTEAFWVFIAAGISDGIDGYIAKRFDQRSELGALLDPIADKTLLVSMFVTLGIAGALPTWLVILAVFRDLLIVGGFLLAAAVGHPLRWEPLLVSKLNTVLQILLVALVLAGLGLGLEDDGATAALVYVVGATTILSGAGYLVRWARGLAGMDGVR
jgi:cardiolipin synthase